MPQARLGAGSWQLESDARGQLRDKLTRGHPTLKQVYGSPLYGIKTGLEKAFVIDRATHDRLIAADSKSAELLKPFLEGKDMKKWRVEPQDLWLIYIPKNRIHIHDYPTIKAHLLPFKAQLEKRATKQEWFELQQAQEAYSSAFSRTKIIFPDISQGSKFSIEVDGYFLPTTGFAIPTGDLFLLGLLNSTATWWMIAQICPALRGGVWRYRLKSQYIETLPIPAANEAQRAEIATLAEACQRATKARRDCQAAFRHRIADLASAGGMKLNTRLQHWWELDFAAFRAEVKKLLKQDIPLAERNDWETYFNSQRDLVQNFTAQIAQHEAALNRAVYALFKLMPDEIALIESGAEA